MEKDNYPPIEVGAKRQSTSRSDDGYPWIEGEPKGREILSREKDIHKQIGRDVREDETIQKTR